MIEMNHSPTAPVASGQVYQITKEKSQDVLVNFLNSKEVYQKNCFIFKIFF